jgi:CubicO group peptidase (beta-lactamase class C family)
VATDPLEQIDRWPVHAAVGVVGPDGTLATRGPVHEPHRWASVTKLLTALALLVAWEEGTVDLDAPAGPPGATLRHLLAHASGLDTDSDEIRAEPATRRIYSNRGIEVAAETLAAAAGMPFGDYLSEAVLQPLGLAATTVDGSPASAARGPLDDLAALARELLVPTLVAPATLAVATETAFAGLDGVLPGFGRQSPCDWGLGFERRGHKHPHWTGTTASPATFGHFGLAGSFLWVDPEARLAAVGVADTDFGPWAREAWPPLADAILERWR